MKGPFTIIFRGHSGSRLLCEAFLQNDFWMGLCETKTRDAREFGYRNHEVRRLIKAAFLYPEASPAEKARLQKRMRNLVQNSKNFCPNPASKIAYGWKQAITTFTIQIFLDAYPHAKAIHLIRDGRDVMLSRLGRISKMDDPLVRLMVFGDANVTEYRGKPLTPEVVEEYRNEIELRHWVTVVRFGMRGRMYANQYMEVRYEELCHRPVETLGRVFEFLEVPFYQKTKEWVLSESSNQRIGKWKDYQQQSIEAVKIGEPLLQELGYL